MEKKNIGNIFLVLDKLKMDSIYKSFKFISGKSSLLSTKETQAAYPLGEVLVKW